jgi:DNA-binding transcriptional MocR family regulator
MNGSATSLVDELEALAGAAPVGARLPSTRELQQRHRVGPATVQRAVADLARRGLVTTRPGEGTFVAAAAQPAPPPAADHGWQTPILGPAIPGADRVEANLEAPAPGVLSLATGYLDEGLQPTGLLAQAATRASRRPAAWSRPPLDGIPELRQLIAAELGAGLDERSVLVAPGGQSALATCFRSLAQPGDTVLVETPTYQGALAAARTAGLVPIGVPTDAGGLRVDALADALEATGAHLLYAQPRWINPTGARLGADRRAALLDLLRSRRAFLVEDDAARDLDLSVTPFVPLVTDDPDGHVVYLRSMSKNVAPALRLAAFVARGPALARLRNAQSVQYGFVSTILQHIACDVLTAPGWPRHVRFVHAELARRRDVLVSTIGEHLPEWRVPVIPTCGLHLWVDLPEHAEEDAALRAAAAVGVRLAAGWSYFPAEPIGAHLRISYGAASPAALSAALTRVAGQLADAA